MTRRPDRDRVAHLVSPGALAMAATAGMPRRYQWARHLEALDKKLVRLHSRAPGVNRSLLVTMPPRHGKSEKCSHWFPTWEFALDPAQKIILASYEAEFAASWGRKVRRSVQEHYPLLGTRILEDSRAAHRWETAEGGGMTTAGVGGPIMGRGASILILDDPIKNAEEANSQVYRDNLWEWWTTTFLTRMEPDHLGQEPIRIVILTRWHEDDLAGRLMASPEFKFWDHLDLPAFSRGQDVDPLGRPAGACLWPERFDEVWLESQKARIGNRAFTALYQQEPAPPEGAAIQRAWWKWYDPEKEQPPIEAFEQIIQSWDTTFKRVDSADFVAGGILGRILVEGQTRFYLLDCDHKRMNGPETLAAIGAMDKVWPQARWAIIEDTASGSMILDILEHERGSVVRSQTKSRQKEVRLHWGVNSAAALIERGCVWIPRGRRWAQLLVNEAANFPYGTHDDLIDMLIQGLQFLLPKSWVAENRYRREQAEAIPKDYWELMSRELHEKIHERIKLQRERASQEEKYGPRFPGL